MNKVDLFALAFILGATVGSIATYWHDSKIIKRLKGKISMYNHVYKTRDQEPPIFKQRKY